MLPPGPSAHSDLSRLLEIVGVTRFKGNSFFTPKTFMIHRVVTWFGMLMMAASCFHFISEAPTPYMLQSLALGTAAIEFLTIQLILISKKASCEDLVLHLRRVYNDIKDFPGSMDFVSLADKKSRYFEVTFFSVLYGNLPINMLFATTKMLLTGDTAYPFEFSVFGLPTAIGWVAQLLLMANAAGILVGTYCIIQIIIYILEAYSNILAHMLRERPVDSDAESDRRILRLFGDINSLMLKLGDLYGLIAFIEVCTASGRCCFLTYQCLSTVQNGDYNDLMTTLGPFLTSIAVVFVICLFGEDVSKLSEKIREGVMESKWYAFSPQARRNFLPVLVFTQSPIQFHYKRFVYFNMETFRNVLKTTYTMTTALSQLQRD